MLRPHTLSTEPGKKKVWGESSCAICPAFFAQTHILISLVKKVTFFFNDTLYEITRKRTETTSTTTALRNRPAYTLINVVLLPLQLATVPGNRNGIGTGEFRGMMDEVVQVSKQFRSSCFCCPSNWTWRAETKVTLTRRKEWWWQMNSCPPTKEFYLSRLWFSMLAAYVRVASSGISC